MQKETNQISPEILEQIETMFFGPYKPEWKDAKGRVDNSDSAIGKRLNLSSFFVAFHTNKISEAHFKRVIKQINKTK